MTMRKTITWDEMWMNIAETVAQRSKDDSRQVGAVLVSPDNRHSAVGYNGLPAKLEDTAQRWGKPQKYDLVLHAEENAMDNCTVRPEGWTLYVTLYPCNKCARNIIQKGISKVVYKEDPRGDEVWHKPDLVEEWFKEAGVQFIKF